ncbi:hypothetical protein SAMN05421739_106136 [Pontibacter chinhatensis]|uniref:Uncharacterized protein n=1 Tax=Pontibacter chinhatensis TaxID=1436961 RepID=A0A1I2XNJ8_9BACT|nr:hypothetical protein SAMN05421739_106136 [Pontibacter chinhatensis]
MIRLKNTVAERTMKDKAFGKMIRNVKKDIRRREG